MHKSRHSHHSSSKPVSQIPSLHTKPTSSPSSPSSTSSSPFLEQPSSLHSSYHGGERLCLQRKAHPQQDRMRQTYRALSSIYIHTETPTVKSTTFATSQRKKKQKGKEEEEKHKLRRELYLSVTTIYGPSHVSRHRWINNRKVLLEIETRVLEALRESEVHT